MSIESSDVTFRHLAIPTDSGTLSGVCLTYRTKAQAESFFHFIRRYFSASHPIPRKMVDVQALGDASGSFTFTVEVGFGDTLRRVRITGVDKKHIDHIRDSLKTFTFYLLAAGYDLKDGEVALLDLSENHLFLNRITINNKRYTGNPDCEYPWPQLIQAEHIFFQSNE